MANPSPPSPPDPFAEARAKIIALKVDGTKTLMNVPYYKEALVVFLDMGIIHLTQVLELTKVLTEIRDKIK